MEPSSLRSALWFIAGISLSLVVNAIMPTHMEQPLNVAVNVERALPSMCPSPVICAAPSLPPSPSACVACPSASSCPSPPHVPSSSPCAPPATPCPANSSTASLPPNGWAARLYTMDGHDRADAARSLPADGLAPETQAVQAALYASQFPASCKDRSFLITRSHCGNGIGSMVHVLGTHLAFAFVTNRTLIYEPGVCANWGDPVTCPGTVGLL